MLPTVDRDFGASIDAYRSLYCLIWKFILKHCARLRLFTRKVGGGVNLVVKGVTTTTRGTFLLECHCASLSNIFVVRKRVKD